MELFDRYDRIDYNGYQLTNILRKAIPIKRILDRIDVYHKYTVKEGERADTLAYDYYGSSTYTWLVYIANGIVDPYYQWPLTHSEMYDYLTAKYGDYYQTQVKISHFANPEKDYVVSEETFNNWNQEQRFGWAPVTIYDHEQYLNEQKRSIRLLSNRYLDVVDQQVLELFR